ncbi:MAG: glycosyltransferase family 39 protein [Acidobacteria bacterium]|nr:glycosyltransferase family 39 protein [Acidobacteriota bacterium]
MLSRFHPRLWIWPALAACLLAVCTLRRISIGFWTDEAGTWWIIKDGLSNAIVRAEWWSATSPLYYSLVWAWAQIFGFSEISLRLPSLLFILAAAGLLFRLARYWLDDEGAWLAVVFFLMSRFVAFAATDARPYALGLALLLAAWVSMLAWLESGRKSLGVVFVLCAAAAAWAHYTIALGLLPLAWYLPRLGWRRSCAVLLGGGLLLAPRVSQLAEVAGRRVQLSFANPPSAFDIIEVFLPAQVLLLAALGGLAVTFAFLRRRRDGLSFAPFQAFHTLAPWLLLIVLPPLALLLLGHYGVQMFHSRYMISREVGIALLCAWLARGLTRLDLRAWTVWSAAILATCFFVARTSQTVDWRGASRWAATQSSSTIAVTSGFIESLAPAAVADPARLDILFAPQRIYPLPGHPVWLPMRCNADAQAILENQIFPASRNSGSLLLILAPASGDYLPWIENRLRRDGFLITQHRRFNSVSGWLFQRSTRPAALPTASSSESAAKPASPPPSPAPSSVRSSPASAAVRD